MSHYVYNLVGSHDVSNLPQLIKPFWTWIAGQWADVVYKFCSCESQLQCFCHVDRGQCCGCAVQTSEITIHWIKLFVQCIYWMLNHGIALTLALAIGRRRQWKEQLAWWRIDQLTWTQDISIRFQGLAGKRRRSELSCCCCCMYILVNNEEENKAEENIGL